MIEYERFQIEEFNIHFEYPSNWKSESEERSTYLFFDEYLGSFRITLIIMESENFNFISFLNKQFEDNLQFDPKWELFNDRIFVCYAQLSHDIADNSKLHYYISGENNMLLLCSFAYDRELINSEKIKSEFEKVEHILNSIEIILA